MKVGIQAHDPEHVPQHCCPPPTTVAVMIRWTGLAPDKGFATLLHGCEL